MTDSRHAPHTGAAEAAVAPVVTAVHPASNPDTVLVQRWKRHGNDRAYVKVNNVQVGYRDVITTEIHCLDDSQRGTIEAATEHLVRNRGNRLTVPGAGQADADIAALAQPRDESTADPAPAAEQTAAAESPPMRSGATSTTYVARHIDPRYAPAGSSVPADPATPQPTAEERAEGTPTGRRRWFRRG